MSAKRAVILAAGRGSRMLSLTDERPKCLVVIGGMSLLERAVKSLHEAGIEQIGVVTGYRAQQVREMGVQTLHNPQWETSGIFQSLAVASSWLSEEPALVVYSDIFFDPHDVRRLAACTADLAIAFDPHAVALWRRRFAEPLSDIESFRIGADGNVLDIGGRPNALDAVQGQYLGLSLLTPTSWRWFVELAASRGDGYRVDMTSLFSALVRAGHKLVGVPIQGPWGEIDSPSDLTLFEELYFSARASL